MNELLLNLLLCLYPREWRNRYGGEVRELIEALSEQQRRSVIGMLPGLIAGATLERVYAFRRFDRAGVVAVTVATMLALGLASNGLVPTPTKPSANGVRHQRGALASLTRAPISVGGGTAGVGSSPRDLVGGDAAADRAEARRRAVG